MRYSTIKYFTYLILLSAFMFSCRGQKSGQPPIHPQQNMDFQNRFNAQEENSFFENNMAMRMPVEGTVSRGNLKNNTAIYEGVDENGDFITENPFEITEEFLYRGKDRYDIYCSVCHGGTGNGRGIIMTGNYGYVPAPSYHREASRNMPEGEFYSAIANGVRTMPSYATQIDVEDRWAIVAYIRALQKSQYVPESEMEQFSVDLAELRQQYQAEQERLAALEAERAAARGVEEISAARGEQLFTMNACNACHSLDGSVLVGPSFVGLYGKERTFEDGTSTVADEEYLYESITQPDAKIVEGFQNAMASYDYLSDGELQSLIEYIKTLSDE
jgi:mono/diheme cytochrome c family protein